MAARTPETQRAIAMRILSVLVLGLFLVAAVTACGGSEGRSAGGPKQEASVSALPDPADTAADVATIRYLALGDSLTQGVGAPDEQTGAFPALLSERWRAEGCQVELRNVGVSGYTAGQVVTDQLPEIESFDPTVITFQAGANDIATDVPLSEYRDNVATILDAATGSGARVIVLAQNEWFRSPEGQNYGSDLGAERTAFDEALIEETTERGVQFVDLRPLYQDQADRNMWVDDGIHPTPEAYDAWSAALAQAIPAPCTGS
jgi:acyl-CoA thioesterase I